MHAEQLAFSTGENLTDRWHRRDHILQAVNSAAFKVHTQKHGHGSGCPGVFQEPPCLLRRSDIARKQDHTAGLQCIQRGSQPGINLQPVISHDEQLPHLLPQFKLCGFGHVSSDYTNLLKLSGMTAEALGQAPGEPLSCGLPVSAFSLYCGGVLAKGQLMVA